jgi:hypothetical protein
MKHKSKIIVAAIIALVLVIAASFYAINRTTRCDTDGERPSDCVPANNRCTPPGDAREAVIDCAEFKYYEAR